MDIPENDWKTLSAIKDELLDNACQRVFEKIKRIIDENNKTRHEAYLELWNLLNKENEEIATMFNDLKRNNAIYKLAALKRNALLTDKENRMFSKETQELADFINEMIP